MIGGQVHDARCRLESKIATNYIKIHLVKNTVTVLTGVTVRLFVLRCFETSVL